MKAGEVGRILTAVSAVMLVASALVLDRVIERTAPGRCRRRGKSDAPDVLSHIDGRDNDGG